MEPLEKGRGWSGFFLLLLLLVLTIFPLRRGGNGETQSNVLKFELGLNPKILESQEIGWWVSYFITLWCP